MQKPKLFVISFAGMLALGFAFPGAARGRQQYHTELKAMYPDTKAVIDSNCGFCHGGEKGSNKKKLNEYATAVGKALGEKNVKDKEKIRKALKEAESKFPI
jgi:hypothetical protein